jgi:hypothetical protein
VTKAVHRYEDTCYSEELDCKYSADRLRADCERDNCGPRRRNIVDSVPGSDSALAYPQGDNVIDQLIRGLFSILAIFDLFLPLLAFALLVVSIVREIAGRKSFRTSLVIVAVSAASFYVWDPLSALLWRCCVFFPLRCWLCVRTVVLRCVAPQ